MITDTHCHLDSEVFREDLSEVIANAKAVGVERFIIPAADLKDLEYAKEIAGKYEGVYFASGVHPYHLEGYDFERVRAMCGEEKCIAVGECGLDYFRLSEGREQEEKEKQKRALIEQIELSIKLNLPLILHVREASNDIAQILREYPKARGVFHCFNADEVLLEFKERFFYGIGGVLTFKNARRLVEVLGKIPPSRLVLETDAPYLTPHPHRGERNEPKFVPLVLQKISEILGVSVEQISKQCEKNTQELFDL